MSPDAVFKCPSADWMPRLIVIDGCNIGRTACGLLRESVDCAGLLSVVRWLLLRDFECVIFLPILYNKETNSSASHVHVLKKLEELGLVTFTPARTGNGTRKAFTNYDDLYLMQLANRHGGCVLSGDRFKDILAQESYSEFHQIILNRVVEVRFLFLTHDVVYFGDDLFYKAAPELFIEEDLDTRAVSISQKIFCSPEDPSFQRVVTRRKQFTGAKRKNALIACDDLLYEICELEGVRPMRLTALPTFQHRDEALQEMQCVRDESVWQPGDSVQFEGIQCFYEEEIEELPLIDLSASEPELQRQPAAVSPIDYTHLLDPFEAVEQRLIIDEGSGDAELSGQLMSIFPRDIVEAVLTMNASKNLNYLAEQCLHHMSYSL